MLRIDPATVSAELARRADYKFSRYFPDCQPGCVPDSPRREDHVNADGSQRLCRVLYPQHLAFFALGAKYQERMCMAGNRCGKTEAGAYELTCHLTGEYPPWWTGRRFTEAGDWWAAGDTTQTTRDILQLALLGPIPHGRGTGMIPAHRIRHTSPGRMTLAVDTIWVEHCSGRVASVQFKCHPAGTAVLMADGTWSPIELIRLGDMVRGPDGQARAVTQLHAYRAAPVVTITTRSGDIKATPNHPFHTQRGWVDAGELKPGDVLTEAFYEPETPLPQDQWKVCLTALMIGDGCLRSRTPFFACADPGIVDMVRAVLPPDMTVVPIAKTISYKISSSLHKENRLKDSLVADRLWGRKSLTKFIPPWVFRLPRDQRIEFLRWLWGCDGSLTKDVAVYSTSSERLAHDVRRLLLTLGIRAPVRQHYVGNQSGKRFLTFTLPLYGHNRHTFSEIGKLNRTVVCKVTPRPKGPTTEVLTNTPDVAQDVFCVGVDDVHELIVEGVRVGNSYDQGRESYQGTAKQGIWLDEEPPEAIVSECLLRTLTTSGLCLYTFTPLSGLTPFVQQFIEGDDAAGMPSADFWTADGLVPARTGFWGEHDPKARPVK